MSILLVALFILGACTSSKSIFELAPSQSMIMTGKGPGQDGAINPYLGEKCVARVQNLGDNPFDVRIQQAGEISQIQQVLPGEKRAFDLDKGTELYLDSEKGGIAKITFKKVK